MLARGLARTGRLRDRAQNKESRAVQLKLNEIVAAVQGASNRLIDVENLSEDEIAKLQEHFGALKQMAETEGEFGTSHTIEEAQQALRQKRKLKLAKPVKGGTKNNAS